jgi:hypothetical protein
MNKVNIFLSLFITLLLRGGIVAQTNAPDPFAQTIKADDLRAYLSVLTSDSLEGRETGKEGNFRAARYLQTQVAGFGIAPLAIGKEGATTYFQRMVYTNQSWDDIALKVNDNTYRNMFNFYAFPSSNPSLALLETNELVFLGYGIDDERYSDYKKNDVKGKVILIHKGEPMQGDSVSWVTGTKNLSNWSVDWRRKLATAQKYGAKCVLIIDEDLAKSVQAGKKQFSPNSMGEIELPDGKFANHVFISPEVARDIIGKQAEKVIKARKKYWQNGKPKAIDLKCKLVIRLKKNFRQVLGDNVLAFIEGSDPKLKHEIVVVSAHYDHLGKRGTSIYRGADDNGSGTSTVLEIAQALQVAKAQGKGTRRSVLCLWVTGEEMGLLGSNYYVNFPIFPLENTIADVNIDMVGRVDEKHKDNPNYIYVIGADKLSTELDSVVHQVNLRYTNITLDYTYNDPNDPNRYYYRSDHYNFAKNGVPAVFYFNGTHDDYHRPSDSIEKINFEKMEKIAKLAFHTVWELANRNKRPEINVKPEK